MISSVNKFVDQVEWNMMINKEWNPFEEWLGNYIKNTVRQIDIFDVDTSITALRDTLSIVDVKEALPSSLGHMGIDKFADFVMFEIIEPLKSALIAIMISESSCIDLYSFANEYLYDRMTSDTYVSRTIEHVNNLSKEIFEWRAINNGCECDGEYCYNCSLCFCHSHDDCIIYTE